MQNDTNSNNSIIFDTVSKIYLSENEKALTDLSFTVHKGEFVCLIGKSGCGKTTALKIVAGLEKQTSGSVQVSDKVSMVFQSGALFPWLSVYENVVLALRSQGVSEEKTRKEAIRYIEMMRLQEFASKYPRNLSGGQRQRVGIARALAVEPEVLLMDEPFSALDAATTHELHEDILEIWASTKKTIFMTSHSIEEAVSLADRIILMKNGVIAKEFVISLPRPRRELALEFSREVMQIRHEFFK